MSARPLARPAFRPAPAVEVFIARCEERARLVASADMELQEAVDGLQAAAVASGLVAELGQDAVQAIMSTAFKPRPERSGDRHGGRAAP
jgi:hypothetical protein